MERARAVALPDLRSVPGVLHLRPVDPTREPSQRSMYCLQCRSGWFEKAEAGPVLPFLQLSGARSPTGASRSANGLQTQGGPAHGSQRSDTTRTFGRPNDIQINHIESYHAEAVDRGGLEI